MRQKTEWASIIIEKTTYNKLKEDMLHFQKVIGGGKWTFNDTIKEYFKILKSLK